MQNVVSGGLNLPSKASIVASDGQGGLADLSPRDEPWDAHRADTERVATMLAGWDPGWYWGTHRCRPPAQRLQACSTQLQFAPTIPDPTTGETRLVLKHAQFCRVRYCPVCQWRRSLRWTARVLEELPRLLEDYPKIRFLFLTLTVRNCHVSDLRETLQQMQHGWAKLTDRRDWPALGYLRSLEVTRNRVEATVHPHYHALLLVPPGYFGAKYLKHSRWVELWRESLQIDYNPIVNIKTVTLKCLSEQDSELQRVLKGKLQDNFKALSPDLKLAYLRHLKHAVVETVKYSVKPSDLTGQSRPGTVEYDLDREWLQEYAAQIRGIRGTVVGGLLRKYLREDEVEADLVHIGEEEQVEVTEESWIFVWRREVSRYLLELEQSLGETA